MMDQGRILQLGTPSELYGRPANLTVARFIGSPAINVLPGHVDSAGRIVVAGVAIPAAASLPAGDRVTVGIRPESLTPVDAAHAPRDAVSIGARLRRVENLGAEYMVHCDVDGLDGNVVICRVPAERAPLTDGPLTLSFPPQACHVFDAGGERIRVLDDALSHVSAPMPRPLPEANPLR
jgi:multiple sugar transport system ATP-binding protein